MDIDFITDVLKEKINCIGLKIIEKNTNEVTKIIEGLFKGIVTHKPDPDKEKEHTFILTDQLNEDGKYIIKGVNKEYYNIVCLKIIGEDNEVNIFATKIFKDQERIYSILKLCLETLISNKMTIKNDNQLVDTNLYKNIPKSISTQTSATVQNRINKSATMYNHNKYYAKQEIKPTFFEFIPSDQIEIDKMKVKLDLILNQQFIPKLPLVNDGEEEKEQKINKHYNVRHGYGYSY